MITFVIPLENDARREFSLETDAVIKDVFQAENFHVKLPEFPEGHSWRAFDYSGDRMKPVLWLLIKNGQLDELI